MSMHPNNDPGEIARMSELVTDFITLVPQLARREPQNDTVVAHCAELEGYPYITRTERIHSETAGGQTVYTDYRIDELGRFTKYQETEDDATSAYLSATAEQHVAHQKLMVATIQATEGLTEAEAWERLTMMTIPDMANPKSGASFLVEKLQTDQEEDDLGMNDVTIEEAEALMAELRQNYPD